MSNGKLTAYGTAYAPEAQEDAAFLIREIRKAVTTMPKLNWIERDVSATADARSDRYPDLTITIMLVGVSVKQKMGK
jgi:hypothetical protein